LVKGTSHLSLGQEAIAGFAPIAGMPIRSRAASRLRRCWAN
jgi:hypothetical protein